LAGVVWKKIPYFMRRLVVRATQDSFTVSAAAVVRNAAGEVLLLDHHIRPRSGWGLPGGFIEHGEQPEEGVRREVREEAGLELDEVRLIRVRTAGAHIEMVFAAVSDGTAEVRSSEIKGLGWFDPSSLPAGMDAMQKAHVIKVLDELARRERR
jgi:ADP-ribose pyrophosphatase YjhB (NUDIX family)